MSTLNKSKQTIDIQQLTAFSAIPSDGIHGICLVIALWPHDPDRSHWLELLQLNQITPNTINNADDRKEQKTHNFSKLQQALNQAKQLSDDILKQFEEGKYQLPIEVHSDPDTYFSCEHGLHVWAKHALITVHKLHDLSLIQQTLNQPTADEFLEQISHLLEPFADKEVSEQLFKQRGQLFDHHFSWLEYLHSTLFEHLIEVAEFCLIASDVIDSFNHSLDFLDADLDELEEGESPLYDQQEALEYIFRAHESDNEEDKQNFIRMALAIDPFCVDALLLDAQTMKNQPEKVEQLEHIVEIAKTQLPNDIEEHLGKYWNIYETRPYLRALKDLMLSYRLVHKRDKALVIANLLCELDSNDEQGNRYWCILLNLEMSQSQQAIDICLSYQSDETDWMCWCLFLAYKIAEKEADASRMFKKAVLLNPAILQKTVGDKFKNVNKQQRHRGEQFFQMSRFLWLNHTNIVGWMQENS
jgi:hypothetical protein